MHLIKFRIQNYKSIRDSGYCWLASDMTTLAGRNESGKTAILEALRDFDPSVKKLPESALPLDDSGKSEITLCFRVDSSLLDNICQDAEITLEEGARNEIAKKGLALIKELDGAYKLDENLVNLIDQKVDEENEKHLASLQILVAKLVDDEALRDIPQPKVKGAFSEIQAGIHAFSSQVVARLPAMGDEKTRADYTELIKSISTESAALVDHYPSEYFHGSIAKYLPHFVFFSDFLDILPFELPFGEAKNNRSVQDFAKVADLDLDKVIQTTDTQRRRNILNSQSAVITGDFMGYWEQNQLELIVEPDGDKLRLGVKEAGKTLLFKTEQRSKGFQWFLSFYLRLNAQGAGTNIILIDEPGLYLHAKAQRDVLKVLEKISQESQVVFSTHSPYLIDADRLDRIRLVLKDDNGTRIENKVHKDADTETLTPVITAIGLELANEFSVAKKRNVLLEGISDYYFLQALKEFCPLKSKLNDVCLIPCVGAPKIPQLASLLMGWGLSFVAVLDNDAEGKRFARELEEKLRVDDKQVIPISSTDGCCTEDLFTSEDFYTYVVLEDTKGPEPNISNSRLVKNRKEDKVLLAKQFFEKVKENKSKIKLSRETIGMFQTVFNKIIDGLE